MRLTTTTTKRRRRKVNTFKYNKLYKFINNNTNISFEKERKNKKKE
jgi:hypothetical protein